MRADHDGDRGVLRAAPGRLERGLLPPAARAETVEVETLVVDMEVVALPNAAQDRSEDRLVDVVHPLAVGAHEVMVMFGNAGHVRGDVTRTFQSRCHPSFDLRFERAVDGRQTETWMPSVQALVQLLS